MKFLRIVLGVGVGLWALANAVPLAAAVAYKFGVRPSPPVAGMDRLFAAMPWWGVGLWAAFVIFTLTTAFRLLFRREAALSSFSAAFIINMVMWPAVSRVPVYAQVFAPTGLVAAACVIAGMLVTGALIWFTERRQDG